MVLMQQFNKLAKKQENCQTILTGIAAESSKPRPSHNKVASSVKFSDDIEKLQRVNAIKKSPVGAQIKRAIDLLFQTRGAFTAEEIYKACFVDINANKIVFDSLIRNNPKVNYDGKRLSYKTKHEWKDRSQLLDLVRKFPDGIAFTDLQDEYPTATEDLEALEAEGQILVLTNLDSEDIAYPNDPKVSIKVDDDLVWLFDQTEPPDDMLGIEDYLRKNGMKPATNTVQRRATAQVQGIFLKPKSEKKRKITRRTKLTNTHLPELFHNLK